MTAHRGTWRTDTDALLPRPFHAITSKSPAMTPHLLRPLRRLFQLCLVFLQLLLQQADLRQKLGLLLSTRLPQGSKRLAPFVQLALLFVQSGARLLQILTATPSLLGISNLKKKVKVRLHVTNVPGPMTMR